MMHIDQLDLHDALVKSLNIDLAAKKVTIELDLYENRNEGQRKSATIIFNGVKSVNSICDLDRLLDNARSGNVCYWSPSQFDGITYIYLVDGCLSILAKSISIA